MENSIKEIFTKAEAAKNYHDLPLPCHAMVTRDLGGLLTTRWMRREKSMDQLATGVFRKVGFGNHSDDVLAPGAGLLERFGEAGKGVVWHSKLLPILRGPV